MYYNCVEPGATFNLLRMFSACGWVGKNHAQRVHSQVWLELIQGSRKLYKVPPVIWPLIGIYSL